MLMTRISSLERESGWASFENDIYASPEGHVMDVRTLKVTPAKVHPKPFRRYPCQGVVQHFYVQFNDFLEFVHG